MLESSSRVLRGHASVARLPVAAFELVRLNGDTAYRILLILMGGCAATGLCVPARSPPPPARSPTRPMGRGPRMGSIGVERECPQHPALTLDRHRSAGTHMSGPGILD